MKKMILLLLMAFSFNGFCQLMSINYTTANPSAAGASDGSITITSINNGTPPYGYNVFYPSGQGVCTQYTTYNGLPAGTYYIQVVDANCNYASAKVMLETTTGNPSAVELSGISYVGETSAGANDGQFTFSTNTITASSEYAFVPLDYGFSFANGPILSSPQTVTGLHLDTTFGFQVFAGDSLTYSGEIVSIYNGLSVVCHPILNVLFVETYPLGDTSVCNGWAKPVVYGGTPPYTYSYSNGGTSQVATGLCYGLYYVAVEDALGAVDTARFFITDSATAQHISFSGPVYDTLYSDVAGAVMFDLSMPVDTAYVDSIYSEWPNEYYVTFNFVQNTDTVSWFERYMLDSMTGFIINANLRVNFRSAAPSKRVSFYLNLTDPFSPTAGVAKIPVEKINPVVWPNPAQNAITVSFPFQSNGPASIRITDVLGKCIKVQPVNAFTGENKIQLPVNTFENGMYFISVEANGVISAATRFIKQ